MDLRKVLPADIVLDGKYRIERVIGAGGFGVTYAAHDLGLNTTVALKEFYPAELGVRDTTMTVRPKSHLEQPLFERLRQSFLAEARVLARFRHPSIVRVLSVFEAHGTAYMAMEFEDGRNLKSWLRNLGHPPTQAELDAIFYPLLDAVEAMHENNFLHRDIAPDNIIIRPNGSPVLLDFGAARRVVTERSSQMTGLIKQGYSPYEQYSTDGKLQGPWSDIYALGATLYHIVMGAPPVESTVRVIDDTLLPAATARGDFRRSFLEGIDAAMRVRPNERPQTIAELREIMFGDIGLPSMRTSRPRPTSAPAPASPQPASALQPSPSALAEPQIEARSRAPLMAAVLAGALATGIFAAYQFGGAGSGTRISTAITEPPATAPPASTPPAVAAQPDTVAPPPSASATTAASPPPPPPTAPTTPLSSTSARDALRNQVAPPATSDQEARQREQEFAARLAKERRELEQRLRDQIENERKDRERAEAQRRETERLERERQAQERERAEAQRRQAEAAGRQPDDAFREALQLATGSGGTQDYARARALFETAASAGRADAMNWLGRIHLNGLGTTADPAKAREWFERAANAGDVASMAQLGQLLHNGQGIAKDYDKARDWFERAAAAGNVASQHQLGTIHYHGIGTPKDVTKAIDFFTRSAQNGDVQSMLNLAHIFRTGASGGQADPIKAREWYERAAAAGHSGAMNQLGVIFNDGLGVAKNAATARSWFERGVANGNTFAMWNLARLLNSGTGGAADYPRTAKLLLTAVKQGGLEQVNRELNGNMARWHRSTRTEIKRELKRIGVYTGIVNDIWDDNARKAVALYRTR